MKSFEKEEKKHKDPEKSKTILIIPCLVTILVILIMFLANAIFLILVRGDVIATTAKPIIEVAVADANKTDNINSYYTVTVKNYNQNDEVSEVSFEYQILVNSIDGSDLPEYTWYDSFGNDVGANLTGTFFHSNKQDQIYTICFKNAGTQDVLQNIKIESKAKQKDLNEQDSTVTLASVAQVGDYVNYNANDNGSYSYTTEESLTGSSTTSTFSSSDTMQWRVLSVDKATGTVELMSADPTASTVELSGQTGFLNAETVLNDIGAVYGHGKGAVSGRSMTIEDVERYSSYDPYTYENSYSSTGYYGGTREYTSGTFYKEIKDEEGKVTGYETSTTTASSSSPVTMTQTFYYYTAESYFENSTAYNMIFKKSTDTSTNKPYFWLASRCVNLYSSYCCLFVCNVGSGNASGSLLLGPSGSTVSPAYAVSAVVSLKSNIQTSGQDESGAWNLVVE